MLGFILVFLEKVYLFLKKTKKKPNMTSAAIPHFGFGFFGFFEV